MAWISAAVAIGGALLQSEASGDAADTAAASANRATESQFQMFNTQNRQQAPYRDAGYSALGALLGGFGLQGEMAADGTKKPTMEDARAIALQKHVAQFGRGYSSESDQALIAAQEERDYQQLLAEYNAKVAASGVASAQDSTTGGVPLGYFSHQFNANDLNDTLAPNYAFMRDQGLGATANQLNVSGGNLSGNALQGINTFAQNYAGNAYQNAFNNYTANQSNIFNRLSTIAGLGSAANQQSSALAGTLAPSIANSQIAGGQAQAAGIVGGANALAGGANNAMGWYQLGNLTNQGGGGSNYNAAGTFQPYYSGLDSSGGPAYG